MSASLRVLSATAVVVTLVAPSPLAGVTPGVGASIVVQGVTARALEIVTRAGGPDGYGGSPRDGYDCQMPSHMDFHGPTDLASGTAADLTERST